LPSTSARTRPKRPDDSPAPELSFAEHVCLALVVEGISHGWALGTLLAPGGELGRIWSLSRPLSYRAIDGLVDKGLVSRRGHTPGHGRDRVLLAPTASGRRIAHGWLATPVEHLRDVRTELLIKLALRQRAGLGLTSLLIAQREVFEPTISGLTSPPGDVGFVEAWRCEQAQAVRRFLDAAIGSDVSAGSGPETLVVKDPAAAATASAPKRAGGRDAAAENTGPRPAELRLSARNQLRASVTAVDHGPVMSTVKAVVDAPQLLTAAITNDAAEDLDLTPGDCVLMVIKSTEVIVAKPS
jgi:molybdopterin-binding protein